MHEINIREMDEGVDGNLAYLGPNGLPLPAGQEEIERIMRLSSVGEPYIVYSYTFRLEELNGRIAGSQPLDDLNSLAEHLANMSEYERVALEGAVKITGCSSIQDCIKLIHNLDRFEITPGVGNLEMLGRHFQLDELGDSLKDVPPAIMELLDYEQLGSISFDKDTSAFIRGHLVSYDESDFKDPDLNRTSLACSLKMRLCSDANPDGVWVKFPLAGSEDFVDQPERSGEVRVALTSLGVDSLEECRIVECVSEYPSLNQCLEAHAGESTATLIWKAQNFSYADCGLSQYGKGEYEKFAAALEYEDCRNLDFAIDITQNLQCYDFAPNQEAYAENYLAGKGVDKITANCFNLEAVGDMLAAQNDAVDTANGVISRNDDEFIYDYYQPMQEQKQVVDTIRLFCPLEVKTDPDSVLGEMHGVCSSEFEYATIPNEIALEHTRSILDAIEKERLPEEGGRGLAHYLDGDLFSSKISSIWPTVEEFRDELYGVMEIKTTAQLTPGEMQELTDWCLGQLSDGWGEGFEQRPIDTQDGELYVSFWQSGKDYFLRPEQEFKGVEPEPEQYQGPTMGGMY